MGRGAQGRPSPPTLVGACTAAGVTALQRPSECAGQRPKPQPGAGGSDDVGEETTGAAARSCDRARAGQEGCELGKQWPHDWPLAPTCPHSAPPVSSAPGQVSTFLGFRTDGTAPRSARGDSCPILSRGLCGDSALLLTLGHRERKFVQLKKSHALCRLGCPVHRPSGEGPGRGTGTRGARPP